MIKLEKGETYNDSPR